MVTRGIKLIALSLLLTAASISPVSAQTDLTATAKSAPISSQFVKKRYSIKGEWSVVDVDGQTQIRFSDDFKTKGGPDLKVFLSKTPLEQLESKTALDNAVSIGVLKSNSGGQIYTVPEDIDVSDFKSVIIHCQAFSVLWGGFELPRAVTTPDP